LQLTKKLKAISHFAVWPNKERRGPPFDKENVASGGCHTRKAESRKTEKGPKHHPIFIGPKNRLKSIEGEKREGTRRGKKEHQESRKCAMDSKKRAG